MIGSIDSNGVLHGSTSPRKKLAIVLAVLLILFCSFQLARQAHLATVRNTASARATQDARLATIPKTAEDEVVELHCSVVFCTVIISFTDRTHLDAWVKASESLAAPRNVEDGIIRYEVPGKGTSPNSTISIAPQRGSAVIDVTIERERCEDICGEYW